MMLCCVQPPPVSSDASTDRMLALLVMTTAIGVPDLDALQTKLCTRWMSGDCRFGDRCNFAHGEHELRSLPPRSDDFGRGRGGGAYGGPPRGGGFGGAGGGRGMGYGGGRGRVSRMLGHNTSHCQWLLLHAPHKASAGCVVLLSCCMHTQSKRDRRRHIISSCSVVPAAQIGKMLAAAAYLPPCLSCLHTAAVYIG